MSVNKVILIGRLGIDPEVKSISNGQNVANFSLATNQVWVDASGQKQEKTEWHRIVAWSKLADLCGKYLNKGRQVYVEGRIQTRSWEDQQGQKRYTTEIIASNIQFLGEAAERSNSVQNQNNTGTNTNYNNNFGPEPNFDASEELPF